MEIEGDGNGTGEFEQSSLEDELPLNRNLFGTSVRATGEFFKPLHNHLTVEQDDLFQFKLPIDMGIYRYFDTWRGIGLDTGAPFIKSSTRFYKYYLKREGESYYTNLLRIMTDLDGNFIGNQIVGVAFQPDALNVFQFFNSQITEIDGKPTPGEYESMYTNHDNGRISFRTSLTPLHGDMDNVVAVENFDLLDHPGDTGTAVFQVGDPPTSVTAEYVRIE